VQVVWLEEVVKAAAAGQLRRGPLGFADRVFANDINSAILETQQARTAAAAVVGRMRRRDQDIAQARATLSFS
jgi:hypothetical protein